MIFKIPKELHYIICFFAYFTLLKFVVLDPFAHYRYYIPPQGTESASLGLLRQLSLIGIKNINDQNYNWLRIDMKENFNKPLALFIPGASKKADHTKYGNQKNLLKLGNIIENLGFIVCVVGTV